MDLGDKRSIADCLEPLEYAQVLVPAALTGVDYCETHEAEAFAVNGEAPGEIARISQEKGARVIHFSTDFVFDGEKDGPYVEDDEVAPLSIYGASKLEGENRVLGESGANLVLRLAWVFGPDRAGFPEWIVGLARDNKDLGLPGDKVGSPTFTPDVAEWVKEFLPGGRAAREGGVFHLSNSGSCSWAEWGRKCLEEAVRHGSELRTTEISDSKLDEVEAFVAKRPRNSALDHGKFVQKTGIVPRPWSDAVMTHFQADGVCPADQI